MARNTMLPTAAAFAFGTTMLFLLTSAHEEMRISQFAYTAHRHKSGKWEFVVKTTGNASLHQEPHMRVEMMVKETKGQPAKPPCWIEITSKVFVSDDKKKEDLEVQQSLNKSSVRMDTSSAPAGYANLVGSGFYKVHWENVEWETARRRCASEGAHLLIINSKEEAASVVKGRGLPTWNWLGFDDFDTEGEYITVHGTTLEEAGYVRWAPDEPAKDLRCGVANKDGLLGTGNCQLRRPFVCEFHSAQENVLETRPPGLPVGYRQVGSLGFYRVRRDVAKWETARRLCAADGAHLMVPNTAEEAAAVLRTSGLTEWFWLGFDDFRKKGQYVNFNGQRLKTAGVYSNFASGEPDAKLHCGVGRASGHLGTGNCDLKRQYICELNKPNEMPDQQPAPGPSPPAGYEPMTPFSHYKVHREVASWEAARRRCADEGAHLLFLNSYLEAFVVCIRSELSSWFWLGFDDFLHAGDYVYFDGTRLVGSEYVLWKKGEPTKDLNCGVALSNGFLGTGNCALEREYICEWDNRR